MNDDPNLITESGREHLSLADRAGLLEADDLDLQLRAPKYDAKLPYAESGHPVHAFNQLRGSIDACVRACRNPFATGASWGRANLSRTECRVLAWRRGGVEEHDRVLRLAYLNPSELRWAVRALASIIRVVVPLAAAAQAGRCRYCCRALPRERSTWLNSDRTCYECRPEDGADRWTRQLWDAVAAKIAGGAS